ncbi:hypothetical protein SAMN04488020_103206 [Palleronia marisminoris]|uniref:Uncharacterized protein n=1 Tax=Palleronia marisminoris TaxID=315423 RepID=A0A1Y5S9I3_9RHOB|nr:hypothetical protein [Palleronia marisminoris]SFG69232.1 hypothetical protein SAMN04488020_103206 [Palleronia marisminoris]SLN35465.1 hypothetical protein PAM7066_01486 [Palleronia marisminoris]
MSYTLTAVERSRLDAAVDRVMAHCRAQNWTVDRSEVEQLPSVRIFALSPSAGFTGWESEVRGIGTVAASIRNSETVAAIQSGESEGRDVLAGMNAEQRINFARANSLDGTRKESKPKLSAEESKAALQQIWRMPNGAERLNMARKMGVA